MDEPNLNDLEDMALRALIRDANEIIEERARAAHSFRVWAKSDDPEWLARNGCPDVVLTSGMSAREAGLLAERLIMLGVKGVEVRQP